MMVMRIFLAGASGVIGQRLIPRLVQAGHVVGGLTRSPSKTELLSHLGAEPILCDVFDREARLSVQFDVLRHQARRLICGEWRKSDRKADDSDKTS
jgi:nucleoside-diphosphate-sugar epimerase